jgi:predicted N-acetyltransferase YhbS
MLKKDRPALVRLLKNTPEFKPFEVEVAEEVIDCYLSDPENSGYYTLVAEDGSVIVGYISYGPTPLTEGTWDLYWQATDHDRQGQGIGGALIKTAEEQIKKAQGRLAIIETSSTPEYEKTRRFHLNRGYVIIACIPDFYAPGDDKLILRKLFK